jgi:hypothetical protein
MSITGREPRLGGERRIIPPRYNYSDRDYFKVQGTKLNLPNVQLPYALAGWLRDQGARVIMEEDGETIDARYVSTWPAPTCPHEVVQPEIFAYHAYEGSVYLTPLFLLVVPCHRQECAIPF